MRSTGLYRHSVSTRTRTIGVSGYCDFVCPALEQLREVPSALCAPDASASRRLSLRPRPAQPVTCIARAVQATRRALDDKARSLLEELVGGANEPAHQLLICAVRWRRGPHARCLRFQHIWEGPGVVSPTRRPALTPPLLPSNSLKLGTATGRPRDRATPAVRPPRGISGRAPSSPPRLGRCGRDHARRAGNSRPCAGVGRCDSP
jgi:hypothetical protein